MNETTVAVVGNVATTPVFRELPTGSMVRFRLAVTSRYLDRTKNAWVDGHTNFFTVTAWRSLAVNVAASVSVGEPLIVQGRLKIRSEDRGNGQQWTSADIEALAVGHDLARGTAAFRRTSKPVDADAKTTDADAKRTDSEQKPRPEPNFEVEPPSSTASENATEATMDHGPSAEPERARELAPELAAVT